MKVILLLVLFLFENNKAYPIEKYECENNEIRIYYQENWYDITLFNVFIKKDICPYVKGNMKIEIDSYVDNKSLDVYVFLNDALLQTKLIEEGIADIKIENPRYKYNMKKNTKEVMAKVKNKEDIKRGSDSIKWAYLFISVWVLYLVWIIIKRNRKQE